ELSAPGGMELHGTRLQREEGVVAPLANAGPGVDPGSPLADDDRPGGHVLAAERLHAEPLGLGVASVLGGAAALLVCHGRSRVAKSRGRAPAPTQSRPAPRPPRRAA